MFDFSFAEFLVIVVAIIFCVKPKDMPGLMRKAGRTLRLLRLQAQDFWEALENMDAEPDKRPVKVKESHLVEDDQGNSFTAYDISDLLENTPSASIHPGSDQKH